MKLATGLLASLFICKKILNHNGNRDSCPCFDRWKVGRRKWAFAALWWPVLASPLSPLLPLPPSPLYPPFPLSICSSLLLRGPSRLSADYCRCLHYLSLLPSLYLCPSLSFPFSSFPSPSPSLSLPCRFRPDMDGTPAYRIVSLANQHGSGSGMANLDITIFVEQLIY